MCIDFDLFIFKNIALDLLYSFVVQLSTRSMYGFDVLGFFLKNVLLILVTYSIEICVELAAIL